MLAGQTHNGPGVNAAASRFVFWIGLEVIPAEDRRKIPMMFIFEIIAQLCFRGYDCFYSRANIYEFSLWLVTPPT